MNPRGTPVDLDSIARAAKLQRGYLVTVPGTGVQPSPVHGLGLFTTAPLEAGRVLATLDGQRVSVADAPGVLFALEWNALTKREVLVRPIRTSYGYINHSHAPNIAIEPDTLDIVTRTDIPAAAELLLDYLAQPLPDEYLESPHAEYLRR